MSVRKPAGTNESNYIHRYSDTLNISIHKLFELMKEREEDIREVRDNEYKSLRTQERKLQEVDERFQTNARTVILTIDRTWADIEKYLTLPSEKAPAQDVLTSLNLILNLEPEIATKDVIETALTPIIRDFSALRTIVAALTKKGLHPVFSETKISEAMQTGNRLEKHINHASELLDRIVEAYRLRKDYDMSLSYAKDQIVSAIAAAEDAKKELDELLS